MRLRGGEAPDCAPLPWWSMSFAMMKKHAAPSFPATRMRRNRKSDWSRRLVAENALLANDLLWPLFLVEGEGKREAVPTMPGVDRLSVDEAVAAAEEAAAHGIPVIALFPFTPADDRDPAGSLAHDPDNLVRSEEHTSELQSRENLVYRLLLEKK